MVFFIVLPVSLTAVVAYLCGYIKGVKNGHCSGCKVGFTQGYLEFMKEATADARRMYFGQPPDRQSQEIQT